MRRLTVIGWGLVAAGALLPGFGFCRLIGLGFIIASVVTEDKETKGQDAPQPVAPVGRPADDDCQPLPDVEWRSLVGSYVEWESYRVGYVDILEGKVFGCTEDGALASELGWPLKNDQYIGEVPPGSRRQIVHEHWKGELDGEEVSLAAESDDYYRVYVSGGKVIDTWKLCRFDKLAWEGAIPKHAFSRVWVDAICDDC